MERLTRRHADGELFRPVYVIDGRKGYVNETDIIDKLAEYEDLEEQGKLLKLPCAVGDTVWCVQMHSGGGRVPNWGEVHQSKFSIRMYDDFGKTVFLAREEAEAALEELERGKGE